MQTITLTPTAIQPKSCVIHIGAGAIKSIVNLYDIASYSKIFVVTDEVVAPLLLDTLKTALPDVIAIILPAGEQHKHIETVQTIWTALHQAGADRKSLVINLGGGVIGDVGGFAAATYMRGIDFLNIPTTLLAQVDSSVGGKNGCNFAGVKNLIGTFDQPIGVVIDPVVLASLPASEFLSGFAEIIKHGLVWDEAYFKRVTSKGPLDFTQDELLDIIAESCRIKTAIVESDTNEGGIRKLVNFGHSVGHAIEALSRETDSPLLHGQAISIGMVVEADISRRQGLLAESAIPVIERAFVEAGLPVRIQSLDSEAIVVKMRSDKKNEHGQSNFTLLKTIGSAVYNQPVPESVVSEAVLAAMDSHQ